MKKLYLLLFALCHIAASYAQYEDMGTVQLFGEHLQQWCSTNNIIYRSKIQDICLSGCRVKDNIMMDFARNSGLNINDYVVPNYLNGFESAMEKGTVNVNVSNIRIITSDLQSYSTKNSVQEKKRAKEIITIACDIKISGVLEYNIKDLFYVKKGKILKITNYEEVIDNDTKERKVKVDFSDLEDTSTLGFTLNYSQHFQAGASIVGQYKLFICSLDFGFNTDSKKYHSDVMNMTDIMNFERRETEYDPTMYITVTPGLFLKYVSVGCGLGAAILNSKETLSDSNFSLDDQGNLNGTHSSQNISEFSIFKFIIRPQLKGFIPLSRSCKMSIGLGYDILPTAKELNGYNIGIGFHFDFDNWDGLLNW